MTDTDLSPELRAALLKEDWELLFKQLLMFAQAQMNQLKWRGARKGALPDGHDATSIAQEAIAQLFDGDCKLGCPYAPEDLWKDLMRLVSNQIHNLFRRKENRLTRGEHDVLPPDEEGAPQSVLAVTPGASLSADQEAIRREGVAQLNKFKEQFNAFLGSDPLLKGLFECITVGIVKREEIAQMLDVDPKTVTNARKRLDRRLTDFAVKHPEYPESFMKEMTNV